MELIIALNTPNPTQAWQWVGKLLPEAHFFKIGLPLYLRGGNDFVQELQAKGCRIFLDLKLMDIPSVVAQAVKAVVSLRPELLTVHSLGGEEMLRAAIQALPPEHPTHLAAVTLLTSLDQAFLEKVLGSTHSPQDLVLKLAAMAREAGIKIVVTSGQEVPVLRTHFPDLKLIVPGVRMKEMGWGDQRRVVTPETLRPYRPEYVVVGRPITDAPDPLAAFRLFREALMGEQGDQSHGAV